MITRFCWLLINPMTPKDFRALVREISKDQFSDSSTTGFIVDSLRPSSLEARFIHRRIFKEAFSDPFGNLSEFERIEYQQTKFLLMPDPPHIEIYNPPRSLNLFINRIGELTAGKAAIYSPEFEIGKWLRSLSRQVKTCKTTGLLISNLQLSPTSTAKILLRGAEDVQDQLSLLVAKRPYKIKEAAVEIETDEGGIQKITIKENGRLTVSGADEADLSLLRSMVPNLGP